MSQINEAFDRTKIYEKLDFKPAPEGYNKRLPWIVQLQMAATNGIQYQKNIGHFDWYPVFNLPVDAAKPKQLMLDIGCGWGRWLAAGADKGFIPIGIDLRLEFCKTSLQTLKDQGKQGYSVVADLKNIPFQQSVFDLVWSFSVIQHTCEARLDSCLNGISNILKPGGYTYLEFPNSEGIRNKRGPAKKNSLLTDDCNSWHVRYYSVEQYRAKMMTIFNNFSFDVHSALGIGVLPEDLKYVTGMNKLLCAVSLAGTGIFKAIAPLRKKADSIYVKAKQMKEDIAANDSLQLFHQAHLQAGDNNLNIVHLLRCPASSGKLILDEEQKFLISPDAGLKYPIIDNIPVMIRSEAVAL